MLLDLNRTGTELTACYHTHFLFSWLESAEDSGRYHNQGIQHARALCAQLDNYRDILNGHRGIVLKIRVLTADGYSPYHQKIRSASGSTSFAGSFLQNFNKPKSYAGILSFAGDVVSGAITEWNYSSVGVQSFLGGVSRLVAKLRTYLGTLSLAGVVSRVLAMLRTVSGAIDFAGAVIASYINADWRRGFMNLIGDPTRYLVMGRISDGNVLAIAGTVTRHSNVERILLDGTLNMSGSIPYKFKDILYFGPPNP